MNIKFSINNVDYAPKGVDLSKLCGKDREVPMSELISPESVRIVKEIMNSKEFNDAIFAALAERGIHLEKEIDNDLFFEPLVACYNPEKPSNRLDEDR